VPEFRFSIFAMYLCPSVCICGSQSPKNPLVQPFTSRYIPEQTSAQRPATASHWSLKLQWDPPELNSQILVAGAE